MQRRATTALLLLLKEYLEKRASQVDQFGGEGGLIPSVGGRGGELIPSEADQLGRGESGFQLISWGANPVVSYYLVGRLARL